MSLFRVYIATTNGPVAIQSITEENNDINSVICLAGKAISLPISPAYEEFVRDPTGVVQRNFGHSAYRLDVTDRIDDGYSWQLGVYLAHALKNIDRLAENNAMADTIVIATGEVNRDLALTSVTGVTDKISSLRETISDLINPTDKIILAVPADGDERWNELAATLDLPPNIKIEVIATKTTDALLERLGVEKSKHGELVKNTSHENILKFRQSPHSLYLLCFVAVFVMLFFFIPSTELNLWKHKFGDFLQLDTTRNSLLKDKKERGMSGLVVDSNRQEKTRIPIWKSSEAEIYAEEVRAPSGLTCDAFYLKGHLREKKSKINWIGGSLNQENNKQLCSLSFVLRSSKLERWFYGYFLNLPRIKSDPESRSKYYIRGPRKGALDLSINDPALFDKISAIRLVVFVTDTKFTPHQKIIDELGDLKNDKKMIKKIIQNQSQEKIKIIVHQLKLID